jgi:DNA polymerase I
MILLDQNLREQGFEPRMLLQIHDELVFEAPALEIPRLAELVGRVMTSALDLKMPLKVDIAAGHNWLDVEPLTDNGSTQ